MFNMFSFSLVHQVYHVISFKMFLPPLMVTPPSGQVWCFSKLQLLLQVELKQMESSLL